MNSKNKHLLDICTGNKKGTDRQHVATKMLPLLPLKTGVSATFKRFETRVNTGIFEPVAEVADVAGCKATSKKSIFEATH